MSAINVHSTNIKSAVSVDAVNSPPTVFSEIKVGNKVVAKFSNSDTEPFTFQLTDEGAEYKWEFKKTLTGKLRVIARDNSTGDVVLDSQKEARKSIFNLRAKFSRNSHDSNLVTLSKLKVEDLNSIKIKGTGLDDHITIRHLNADIDLGTGADTFISNQRLDLFTGNITANGIDASDNIQIGAVNRFAQLNRFLDPGVKASTQNFTITDTCGFNSDQEKIKITTVDGQELGVNVEQTPGADSIQLSEKNVLELPKLDLKEWRNFEAEVRRLDAERDKIFSRIDSLYDRLLPTAPGTESFLADGVGSSSSASASDSNPTASNPATLNIDFSPVVTFLTDLFKRAPVSDSGEPHLDLKKVAGNLFEIDSSILTSESSSNTLYTFQDDKYDLLTHHPLISNGRNNPGLLYSSMDQKRKYTFDDSAELVPVEPDVYGIYALNYSDGKDAGEWFQLPAVYGHHTWGKISRTGDNVSWKMLGYSRDQMDRSIDYRRIGEDSSDIVTTASLHLDSSSEIIAFDNLPIRYLSTFEPTLNALSLPLGHGRAD